MATIGDIVKPKRDTLSGPEARPGGPQAEEMDWEELLRAAGQGERTVEKDERLLDMAQGEIDALSPSGPLEKGTFATLLAKAREGLGGVRDAVGQVAAAVREKGSGTATDDEALFRLMEEELAAMPVKPVPPTEAAPKAPQDEAKEKLEQARTYLAAVEKAGKMKKPGEYEAAREAYEKARAEVVAGNVEKWLEEQTKLTDERAFESGEDKGLLARGYDAYKKLGEWNLGALLKTDEKLRAQEGDTKLKRAAKATGRFATRTVSVRTAVSAGLFGLGLSFGASAAVGAAAFGTRRIFSGLGAGIGSYDLMKVFSEKRALGEKGMRKELTEQEIDKLTTEDIAERMNHFMVGAALNGQEIGENKTYILLQEKYKIRLTEADASANLDSLMLAADEQIEAIAKRAGKKEKIMKGVAVGLGAVVGSGALYMGVSKGIRGALSVKDYFGDNPPSVSVGPDAAQAAEAPTLEQAAAPQTFAATAESTGVPKGLVEPSLESRPYIDVDTTPTEPVEPAVKPLPDARP
ncbi:MAG: hypothetical protein Q8L21_02295, partial [Candidatus Komeilibacteria bacterium]|nr:hypothetical protein [Candidatus Komeilibacteria bacterium]